jgi:hypothetical protein
MSISNDPQSIPFDRFVMFLSALGLDPVDPKDIRRVTIDPMGIEVVRFRRTETGTTLLGFDNQPLSETVTIRFAS